jgi:hypothetical protein
MKIVLTKETKESFKLFDDIFQFFRLAGATQDERDNDQKNLDKYEWDFLNDLMPLDITTTTDMAADWKISGVGGGVKKMKMFCTLCPCSSEVVHLPSETPCDRFCHGRDDDWYCYHHPILCGDVKTDLMEEAERLRTSIASDLDDIKVRSKIRYFPNVNAPARTTNKYSIHFIPQDDDDRDQFVELLSDELLVRHLSPRGELEELRDRLLQEVVLEEKLKSHLEKLLHCDRLTQCIIALLHKIPCILHCENRVGIKLLTMILIEGFSNVQQGLIFSNIRSESE